MRVRERTVLSILRGVVTRAGSKHWIALCFRPDDDDETDENSEPAKKFVKMDRFVTHKPETLAKKKHRFFSDRHLKTATNFWVDKNRTNKTVIIYFHRNYFVLFCPKPENFLHAPGGSRVCIEKQKRITALCVVWRKVEKTAENVPFYLPLSIQWPNGTLFSPNLLCKSSSVWNSRTIFSDVIRFSPEIRHFTGIFPSTCRAIVNIPKMKPYLDLFQILILVISFLGISCQFRKGKEKPVLLCLSYLQPRKLKN